MRFGITCELCHPNFFIRVKVRVGVRVKVTLAFGWVCVSFVLCHHGYRVEYVNDYICMLMIMACEGEGMGGGMGEGTGQGIGQGEASRRRPWYRRLQA